MGKTLDVINSLHPLGESPYWNCNYLQDFLPGSNHGLQAAVMEGGRVTFY